MTYERAVEILDPEHREHYESIDIVDEACRMGMEALKKQMPKKPLKSDRKVRYCEVFECQNCGLEFSGRIIKYCYRCGQAFDWSGIECH